MNSINFSNDYKTSFKATADEIKSIQKACEKLQKNYTNKPEHKEPVDVAEIGSKAFISTIHNGNKSLLKIELCNNKGANAYTLINTKSPEKTKTFLNLPQNVKKIADIIDSLKETVKKTTEREFYTD